MPNVFWFYGVTIIGIGMTVFTIWNKKNFTAISLTFFLTMGLLALGEFFILTVFGAYAYKPEVFADYFKDDIIGYVLGNWSVWTGTAILVVNFSLSGRWILFLSGVFMLIETLFLNLGIYEHHWWRTYMTGIAVILGLNIIKVWISKLNEKPYKFLQYISFYLIALLLINVPTNLLLVAGKQHYSFGLVENFYRDSVLFGFPYHAALSLIYVFSGYVLQKRFWRLMPILFFMLSDFILVNMNILIFQDQWNLFYLTILRTMSLVIFIMYKEYACTALDKH